MRDNSSHAAACPIDPAAVVPAATDFERLRSVNSALSRVCRVVNEAYETEDAQLHADLMNEAGPLAVAALAIAKAGGSLSVFAYFFDGAGSPLDQAAHHIFREHNGMSVGSGMFLAGENSGERDVQYEVPIDRVADCVAALKKAGLRARSALEPRP